MDFRAVEGVCGLPHSAQHFGLQNGLSDTEIVQIFRCAGPNREALFIAKRGARRKNGGFAFFSRRPRSLFAPPGSLRSETVAGYPEMPKSRRFEALRANTTSTFFFGRISGLCSVAILTHVLLVMISCILSQSSYKKTAASRLNPQIFPLRGL